jgi:hypothetical protein
VGEEEDDDADFNDWLARLAERRARRKLIEESVEARRAELRMAKRAERAKELDRLQGVMKFVSARMAKPKETA